MDWAGARKFEEGRHLLGKGIISKIEHRPPRVDGQIAIGNRTLRTAFEIQPDGTVENCCPCYDNRERGIVCAHVIALALALRRQWTDPEHEARREEERRRSRRVARVSPGAYHRRAAPGAMEAVPASMHFVLGGDWEAGLDRGRVPVECRMQIDGRIEPADRIGKDLPLRLSERDEALLFVVEDIAAGPAPGELEVGPSDFINLLNLLEGRPLAVDGVEEPLRVGGTRLPSRIRVNLDRENGELLLDLCTEVPMLAPPDLPRYVVGRKEGWVFGAGHFWPLDKVLPEPLQSAYRQPVVIPRIAVPRFMREELPALTRLFPVECDVTEDLFSIEPARPVFRLVLRGSEASLSATLYADYEGTALIAGKPDPAGHFSIPDPEDLLRYTVRNHASETDALATLDAAGFRGERGDTLEPIIGQRDVLNFLARGLPALRRAGWRVEISGRVSRFSEHTPSVTPVVRIESTGSGQDWFDVDLRFEDTEGTVLKAADIQRALLRGDSYLERDGRTVLFDSGAIESMRAIFEDCESTAGERPGGFRMNGIYAPYIQASLAALEGIDVECDPQWRRAAEARYRQRDDAAARIKLPRALARTMRGYQREGVGWLRSLEVCGFAGILADEMGLGKTIQALAWIELARALPEARGRPALVVCPTSLVQNWAEESARFTPGLRVECVAGADRHQRWDRIERADLVVTSYALMRRDVDRYRAQTFAIVILDEAQHIKNRGTRNAIAAKSLKAHHRLVLTGTPVENSVTDLWSIMDFLMPGYLGRHEAFRKRYEQPIALGGAEGESAQERLRRKLRPFLLRRLKRDVARELPPKIQRVATCELSPDQRAVYLQVLEQSRRRLAEMVAQRGEDATRMEALKTLLRLRQICCHLDLLKLEDLEPAAPSAKLDLLMELLDEAFDSGHRVLLFSQFVSMLHILRRALDARGVRTCYLDGATKNRMDVVRTFNTDRSIPLFLISLKAGGTGLNLTGADMVVHYDPWWNPAVEDQATDRAYRIGQKRTVYSVKLIARDTVEEKVLALQRRKQAVIDATVRADSEAAAPLHRMSWDDIRTLLDL